MCVYACAETWPWFWRNKNHFAEIFRAKVWNDMFLDQNHKKFPIFPQKIMVTFYILYFLFFSHRPYFSFVASFRALNAAVTDKNTRCRYGVFQILGDECIDRHQ